MKIAIIGTRGVPARYGGFETIAEALSTGFAKKGHQLTVYCRKQSGKKNPDAFHGINLIYTPFIDNKYLSTFSHTFTSILHTLLRKYDVSIVFNVGVVPLCLILKILNRKVILNVDGFEWYRKKWNVIAKFYFMLCASMAKFVVDEIITDSKDVQKYYKKRFSTKTIYLTNGAYIIQSADRTQLKKFDLLPYEFFFTASRLVPENNIDIIIEAFKHLKTKKVLVIAGGSSHSEEYVNKLLNVTNKKIIMIGPLYNPKDLAALHHYCYAYVHGNDAGGTSLGLLKALGFGNCVFTIQTQSNKEVVGESAILYKKSVSDLAGKLSFVIKNPLAREKYKKKAINRIKKYYTWEKIVESYEKLLLNVSGHS